MDTRKAIFIGLDCAAPELMFHRFIDRLPNFSRMMKRGVFGKLESCEPPITIPAWMVMTTGRNPGTLGLYGFRHRRENSYNDIWIASSTRVREKRLWDYVADKGRRSCVVGVPPSYPPYPVKGCLVGGFITPDTKSSYTYPEKLKDEINQIVGEYPVDVEFRIDDKQKLLDDLYDMSEKHFKVIEHLLKTKDWSFFMFVEIGLDRVHHAFWKYFDEEHHLYQPDSEFETVIEDYYVYLDNQIGKILHLIDDDTVIFVASDHGAKRMKGAFCINSWLVDKGLLKLTKPVEQVSRLEEAEVDWKKTKAWGWGGYYARVFLNLKNRESQGVVSAEDYERVREEIGRMLLQIRGPNGEEWNTKVLKPDEIFDECHGDPPDLMVYLDDLYWRSAGTVGHGDIYLPENDTGPDDAVHDKMGLYIYYDPKRDLSGMEVDLHIIDVAPTLLKTMGIPVPVEMKGKPLSCI